MVKIALYDMTLAVYNLSLVPIIFFSLMFIILSIVFLMLKREEPKSFKNVEEYPFVSVQVPTFNDPIAERCIRHCMDFDYPKDKYEIIIADDSTNTSTQALLKEFETKNPGFIKYIHRQNREGFKPGALRNAMKITKGEIIVVFDSDWMPARDFLNKIIQPFADERVALVQTRQTFYNKDTNLITRFAAYVLMFYHTIIMPINNKINCVFFCGTAGALRRSVFDKVGGWNLHSLTEDSDLTISIILSGHKSVYLDIETPSEVPDSFESFVKQQMRWCYGNTRVFLDNSTKILFKRGVSLKQRFMMLYVTLGNIIAPFVVLMTIFGFLGWFIGDIELIKLSDITTLIIRFGLTSGFIIMGLLTLHKAKIKREFPYMILSIFTVGVIIAFVNSIAFFRALLNKKPNWYCTPKIKNDKFVE